MRILKVSDHLSDEEREQGVEQIKPVWGTEISTEKYIEYMNPRVFRGERLLYPGELGCTLAHINAYKTILGEDKAALVVEDDIEVEQEKVAQVAEVVSALQNADFIHLCKYEFPLYGWPVQKNIYRLDTSRNIWGTAAYFISPHCAKLLLDYHKKYVRVADHWKEFFRLNEQPVYYSPVFYHSGEESNIGTERLQCTRTAIRTAASLHLGRKLDDIRSRLTISPSRPI